MDKREELPGLHIEKLKRRFDDLNSDRRANWENHWEQIAQYILPRKQGFVGMRSEGEQKMRYVYDSTAIHANELLASALHGLATNPASKWFGLRMTVDDMNEIDQVRTYLSDVEGYMWAKMYAPGTNFATSLHESYLELGAFGTAVMFIGERIDGGLLTDSRPLHECYISQNEEGVVDTLFRRRQYTTRQLWLLGKTRGWDLPSRIEEAADSGKWEEKHWVVHGVTPREERNIDSKAPNDMAWASTYFLENGLHKLDEGGFPEFPYLVPRWTLLPGEQYGRCPAMTALPDVKMLNVMMLTLIKALQKAVDPPLWLPYEGAVGPTRTIPGGVNFYKGDRMPQLHPTSLQGIQVVTEAMEQLRDKIRQTFYSDVVQTYQHDREMTAFEVEQRQQERMRLMGPLVGRLESELLGPLIDRVYGIMERKGELPVAPEMLDNQEFIVEYVSPLANVQKQTSMRGIETVMGMFAQMGDPGLEIINRNTNLDKLYQNMWHNIWNLDPDVLIDEEEVEAGKRQNQQMQMMQQMGPAADAMQSGTAAIKNLSDAGVDATSLAGMQQAAQSDQAQGAIANAAQRMNVDPQQISDMINGAAAQ